MQRRQILVFVLLLSASVGVAGESLCNGIVLLDEWPPLETWKKPGDQFPLWVNKDRTGKSGGCVAVGGPDFSSARDE